MSYRPPGWKNPFVDPSTQPEGSFVTTFHSIYEAGADAMLAAITDKAIAKVQGDGKLFVDAFLNFQCDCALRHWGKGWYGIVFIPDEKVR